MKEFTGKSPHHSDTNTSPQLSVGTGEEMEGQSLLEGSYDEAASAKMFEEALKSWRNSSKQDETPPRGKIKRSLSASIFTEFTIVASVESVSCGVQASTSEDGKRISMDALESITSNSSNTSSYFEKLLLKRVKANPSFFTSMTSLSSPTPRIAPEPLVDEEHDHAAASVMISPYNIFYSSDCEHDLLNIESTDNVSIPVTPSTVSVEELNPMPSHTASSNLSLQPAPSEEHATKEDNLIVSNETQSIEAGRQYTAAITTDNSEPVRLHSSSSKKPSTTVSSLPSSAKVKQKTQSSKTSKKIKKSPKSNSKGDSIVKQPLSEVALAASVEQLWTNMSSQSVTQQQTYDLSCLFMTSVANNSSSPPPNEKEPNHEMRDAPIITGARGEGSVWLPHSSTTNDEAHVASEKEDTAVLDQFDLPPPGNTVSSSLFQQDQFTDDSDDSDSDQTLQWEEGEGEEEREEEEDNELVRELTSMCTLTSEEGKEEEEEEEGDEERVWSRMTIDDLIHDFDVYQDQVREQDESM